MANFWDLGDGETVTENKEYEAPQGGGDYIFADGTKVGAVIEEMKWDSFQEGEEFISIRWSVFAPETDADGVKIANRKIFQKLYTGGDAARNKDEEKRAKKAANAKRMLGAIATNAGGGLLKIQGVPTNEDFASNMLMKPMTISLRVWEMEINGDKKKGNWISAVGPFAGSVGAVAGADKAKPKAQAVNKDMPDDSDIPF